MKTVKNIILGIITVFVMSSCDLPVGLGEKLDLEGPELIFTSPAPRKAVNSHFLLTGTVSDTRNIKQMLVKVEKDRDPFPRQWRNIGGKWEISDDYGSSWSAFSQASWEGSNFVNWGIQVDMTINGVPPDEGQYMFIAQAWDKGELSDDNSFKTLILIIDNEPPSVSINKPLLYDRYLSYDKDTDKFDVTSDDGKELEKLRNLTDWRDSEIVGKFQTNEFDLQWSIEENFNIWSFDLRLYKMDVEIDEDKSSSLPEDYIYRVYQNSQPMPESPPPSLYVRPNGTVRIPALNRASGDYGNGYLKSPITTANTTIRVVAVCYDVAGHPTEEKTLGYFIYWADADIPWITFSGDIKTPEYYNNTPTVNSFNANVQDQTKGAFMIYPRVAIKAIAFHAQGIQKVTYSLYRLDDPPFASTYAATGKTLLAEYTNIEILNQISSRGKFDWGFEPVPRSAYYVVTATTLSISGKTSDPVSAIFRVQDITFPDFPQSVKPPALDPLFQNITSDSITISGVVADATEVDTLCLVWINPQSKNAAANAQLEYFRDADYQGWKDALTCVTGGAYKEEGYFDSINKNKLWKLNVTKSTDYPNSINPATQRVEYKFSKIIPISDLNIGISVDKQPLKSQVFLLRAANKNPKVTIITYTPQGDESPPTIEITNAVIKSGLDTITLTPGQFGQEIKKFKNGDTITINGTWKEDSIKYLDFNTYLKDNFKITINQTILTPSTFTGNTPGSDNGTWQVVATVKDTAPFAANNIPLTNLKDTMVVSATLKDIGGNVSEDGASWLIESDQLRLVRISSEAADQTYNSGNIDIFLEFNKPVLLKSGRSANPVLTLKVGGGTATAAYITVPPQSTQSTRQYFRYRIDPGQNALDPNWLDVLGLDGALSGNYWEPAAYPFTWVAGTEEIRITKGDSGHLEGDTRTSNGVNYYVRRIPVATNITPPPNGDVPYTLAKGKNIGIDTQAPTVQSIYSSNKAGHYAEGSEIIINVVFSEAVKISGTPQLNLQVYKYTGGPVTVTSVTTDGTVKVNDKTVTFSYTVKATDTTGDKKVIVTSFTGGSITDIAGNAMAAMTLSETNRSLNGGSANNGDGIFINTISPAVPVFRALKSSTNTDTITNNFGTGVSGASAVDLKSVYNDELWFAIIGDTNTINTGISATGNQRLQYLEYSLDATTVNPPINWKRIDSTTGAAFKQDIYGKYTVRVRQIDKAGNASAASNAVSLNWDPGEIITRIDSSTPNGTYTNNSARQDKINITLYFRKPLTITGTPQITLNAIRGAGSTKVTVDGVAAVNTSYLSFTYSVAANDNTPNSGTTNLDVDALNITATDTDLVNVNSLIKLPSDSANRLINRKEIKVVTSALALSGSNPTYAISASGDEATGTIMLTYNRSISKRSGDITITQKTANYRLPAVLTETQAARYKSARNFNTYYSRGTNGADNGVPDTSTKFVLSYEQTTVVTPNNGGTAQEQMAYDFLMAEKVTLPISSQDITITGNTLTINLTGLNALQVLGATYDIVIPEGLVQDSLGYQSPAVSYNGSGGNAAYTAPGVNRPFVRVDKKVNMDRIESAAGNNTSPYLMANFNGLIQTRARLDCRTPSSIVRYRADGAEHRAIEVDSSQGIFDNNGIAYNGAANYYKNTNDNADENNLNNVTVQNVAETGTDGTEYSSFSDSSAHITVGTSTYTDTNSRENLAGYVWRIGVRSRNGSTNNSAQYEEIAFRTVLTYEVNNFSNTSQGQTIGNGDQIWIRGGDAPGSSTVSGFPLNWQDDYGKLNTDKNRAGIKLLRRVTYTTNMNTLSIWRWVSWEINVRTWFDIVLAHNIDASTPSVNEAWQYGPRQWAYQRAGWTAAKEAYTLYPGKHRWLRNSNGTSYNSGTVNFSLQFFTRGAQGITYTQPSP